MTKRLVALDLLYTILNKVYTKIVDETNEKITSTKLELNEKIEANSANIEANTSAIETNSANIEANTSAIEVNTEEIITIKELLTTNDDINTLSSEYFKVIETE